jgi:ATPase subunit of ABC transporter with duplicated ATPase domains
VHTDKTVQAASAPTREAVAAMLGSVGFTPALQNTPIASLSGGWKMKLALGECRAWSCAALRLELCLMLRCCDVPLELCRML